VAIIEKIECESLSVDDVLKKIENSFNIQFGDNELQHVKTFGELYNIIDSKILLAEVDDCTTQQAFYKLRCAIAKTQNIDKQNIQPQSLLKDIFPKKNRRGKIVNLEENLGFKIDILVLNTSMTWLILLVILTTIVCFFIYPEIAIVSILLNIVSLKFISKTANQFSLNTVGELTEKIAREHYVYSRSINNTINRIEIKRKIEQLLISDLFLKGEHIAENAEFSFLD
jgi:uncharacterized membrane protein